MLNNKEIRAAARNVLGRRVLASEWLYTVLIYISVSFVTGLISATYVGILVVAGLTSVATAAYLSGRVRGMIGYRDLGITLDAVKRDAPGAIITGLLYTVFIALWTLLLIVPGIIKACSYAMTFFIKNDHPEYSATEAINESKRLMEGNKKRFFLLQLSFVGWYIVGLLCLGVGIFWVQSYVGTANAIFYEELLLNDHPARAFYENQNANRDPSNDPFATK